jgi:hypothetical protein
VGLDAVRAGGRSIGVLFAALRVRGAGQDPETVLSESKPFELSQKSLGLTQKPLGLAQKPF